MPVRRNRIPSRPPLQAPEKNPLPVRGVFTRRDRGDSRIPPNYRKPVDVSSSPCPGTRSAVGRVSTINRKQNGSQPRYFYIVRLISSYIEAIKRDKIYR